MGEREVIAVYIGIALVATVFLTVTQIQVRIILKRAKRERILYERATYARQLKAQELSRGYREGFANFPSVATPKVKPYRSNSSNKRINGEEL